jgi:hypothetical protein
MKIRFRHNTADELARELKGSLGKREWKITCYDRALTAINGWIEFDQEPPEHVLRTLISEGFDRVDENGKRLPNMSPVKRPDLDQAT